jgi:hypothetical protein
MNQVKVFPLSTVVRNGITAIIPFLLSLLFLSLDIPHLQDKTSRCKENEDSMACGPNVVESSEVTIVPQQ